ncbi:uncharacterized protein LOC118732738 [Rhagoletis pomonella]|uniref:uncharacterized protein LOC118732738 n=1 Tax=Rhagoletis pomonella TaxID=28610 RepID=UPI001781A28C|nr:uncharacterized protein LOC118732738 [Rhagoletis pomonella]
MNCETLKQTLRELQLETTGVKKTLQDRLLLHYGVDSADDDQLSSVSVYGNVPVDGHPNPKRSVFTFKDIEESLSQFNGTDAVDIRRWVEEFEEIASAVGWNEVQKFIYSKQLLKGAAKLFIRSERGLVDWETLKKALMDEFGAQICSSEVHKKLRNRKKE